MNVLFVAVGTRANVLLHTGLSPLTIGRLRPIFRRARKHGGLHYGKFVIPLSHAAKSLRRGVRTLLGWAADAVSGRVAYAYVQAVRG